jgi:hypothetical protein
MDSKEMPQGGNKDRKHIDKCVFKINVKINKKIFEGQYDYILHGFYKFTE